MEKESTTRPPQILSWRQSKPGIWRSTDGRYVVIQVVTTGTVDGAPPRFQARKIDASARLADPEDIGHLIAFERIALEDAQQQAENDASTTPTRRPGLLASWRHRTAAAKPTPAAGITSSSLTINGFAARRPERRGR